MIPVFKAVQHNLSAVNDRTFFYPPSGPVKDRDGWGLHGLAYGIGPETWWDFIHRPKFLVIAANNVTIVRRQGKCEFDNGFVLGCYDCYDQAALHIATLTSFWTAPAAAEYLNETPDDWHVLVKAVSSICEFAESERKRRAAERQRLRESHRSIAVPGWPMPQRVPVEIKQNRTQHAKAK